MAPAARRAGLRSFGALNRDSSLLLLRLLLLAAVVLARGAALR